MNRSYVRVLLGLMTLLLAGCGFKMQGVTPMPFDSLAITIPQNTQFGADVRRAIRAASPGIVIIEPSAIQPSVKTVPQARLEQVSEVRNSRIVSLNAQASPKSSN
jgi:LPS-assembly lipoprotein